jgi:aminoglycoside phosphotransferase (APT) family kinase protein
LSTEKGTGNMRLPNMLQLAEWLKANAPMHDARIGEGSIVHGDYRLDNLIFSQGELPHDSAVAAVLDWELCTLGDPLCDLAGNCLVCTNSIVQTVDFQPQCHECNSWLGGVSGKNFAATI